MIATKTRWWRWTFLSRTVDFSKFPGGFCGRRSFIFEEKPLISCERKRQRKSYPEVNFKCLYFFMNVKLQKVLFDYWLLLYFRVFSLSHIYGGDSSWSTPRVVYKQGVIFITNSKQFVVDFTVPSKKQVRKNSSVARKKAAQDSCGRDDTWKPYLTTPPSLEWFLVVKKTSGNKMQFCVLSPLPTTCFSKSYPPWNKDSHWK